MTAPAGCLSLPQYYLRETLAASASWQAECHATNVAQAAARIYYEGLPAPADRKAYSRQEIMGMRPYAVVYTAPENGLSFQHDATGDHFGFLDSGQVMVRIERNSPEDFDDAPTAPANLDFKNLIGNILDQMKDLAGKAGYLAFTRGGVVRGPSWGRPNDKFTKGLVQDVLLMFFYGQ